MLLVAIFGVIDLGGFCSYYIDHSVGGESEMTPWLGETGSGCNPIRNSHMVNEERL